MRYHLGISSEMSNPRTRTADRTTRPPAVAGQFYSRRPGPPSRRSQPLWAVLPRAAPSGCPKAIIAPHAGYRYSGQVAAAAFATLKAAQKASSASSRSGRRITSRSGGSPSRRSMPSRPRSAVFR